MFVEGATEEVFYREVIKYIEEKKHKVITTNVEYRNVEGVFNIPRKAVNIFLKQIKRDYGPECEYSVALCFDTDVVEDENEPDINWTELKKNLKSAGASKVLFLKAKHSIEDWFLIDLEGILIMLKLSTSTKVSGTSGYDTIKKTFRLANQEYKKGEKCQKLIDNLNMDKILEELKDIFLPLENELTR